MVLLGISFQVATDNKGATRRIIVAISNTISVTV